MWLITNICMKYWGRPLMSVLDIWKKRMACLHYWCWWMQKAIAQSWRKNKRRQQGAALLCSVRWNLESAPRKRSCINRRFQLYSLLHLSVQPKIRLRIWNEKRCWAKKSEQWNERSFLAEDWCKYEGFAVVKDHLNMLREKSDMEFARTRKAEKSPSTIPVAGLFRVN